MIAEYSAAAPGAGTGLPVETIDSETNIQTSANLSFT